MKILKNSAQCTTCGVEIESKHRHGFATHTCPDNPVLDKEWNGDELALCNPTRVTWNFFVDGGKDYIRRGGQGFVDTSLFSLEPAVAA